MCHHKTQGGVEECSAVVTACTWASDSVICHSTTRTILVVIMKWQVKLRPHLELLLANRWLLTNGELRPTKKNVHNVNEFKCDIPSLELYRVLIFLMLFGSGELQNTLQLRNKTEHCSVPQVTSTVFRWSQCLAVQECKLLRPHVLCDTIKQRVKI